MQKSTSGASLIRTSLLRAILPLLLTTNYVFSQVSIASNGFNYFQDFNTLTSSGTWANNLTLEGWYALSEAGGFYSSYETGDGSSGTTRLYSYGNTTSDRALGSINQNASGHIIYGVLFTNNSGVTLQSIQLSFRVEQWRRSQTKTKGYQRVRVSYQVASAIDLSTSGLRDESLFTNIPEAYLISPDSTTLLASTLLDGNTDANSDSVSVSLPVTIPPDEQFFLRFFDNNVADIDHALAIDNFRVVFSSTSVSAISVHTRHGISAYLDQGIVIEIPDEDAGIGYIVPSATDLLAWSSAMNDFWSDDLPSINLSTYGYEVVEYEDMSASQSYSILRKDEDSNYYWGTYVNARSPGNAILVIQSPHPSFDSYTGTQGAAIFELTGARAFMMAGIHRCVSSAYSPCSGTTGVCGATESFRMSDLPHTDESAFYEATIALADSDPALVFVQMHGFQKGAGDPDFIISSGTLNENDKYGADYPQMLEEQLTAADPTWTYKIPHMDNYSNLAGTTNTIGRYLNEYPGDDCEGGVTPTTVTNRFLHIEQYWDVRKYAEYYDVMASAINATVNPDSFIGAIIIQNVSDEYSQNFDALSSTTGTENWINSVQLPGWYSAYELEALFEEYNIGDGSSGTIPGLYSFGEADVAERALGSLNRDNIGDVAYGLLLENRTGVTIQSVTLSYRAEQWRRVSAATPSQRVTLSYRIDDEVRPTPNLLLTGSSFVSLAGGDLVTLDDNSVTGSMDGNTNFTQLIFILSSPWNDGQQLLLRFFDENISGVDKAMAIDDLVITFSTTVLPVRWINFEVNEQEGFPSLSWTTAEEEMCERYEVRRSSNGRDFEVIASMPCNGEELNNYTFTDKHPPVARFLYYRLTQYDYSGEVDLTGIKALDRRHMYEPQIFLDENRMLRIVCGQDEAVQAVSIVDVLGRSSTVPLVPGGSGSLVIDCGQYGKSIMIVRVVINNTVYTRRIIN